MKKYIDSRAKILDATYDTPKDYSIMMCDLPKDQDVGEIKSMIKKWLTDNSRADIIDDKLGEGIIQIFETTSLEDLKSQKLKTLNSSSKLKLENEYNNKSQKEDTVLLESNAKAIENADEAIKKLDKNMQRIIKHYNGGQNVYEADDKKMGNFTGIAIITFKNQ